MSTWRRIARAGRRILRGEEASDPGPRPAGEPFDPLDPSGVAGGVPESPENEPGPDLRTIRGLSGWVEERAHRVVARVYETRVGDLEERARRVVSSAYERSADDLEERAVRAMRRALRAEARRIQKAIEHGIAVKKREVRLSLLVLVVSSMVYLALYWFTSRPTAP